MTAEKDIEYLKKGLGKCEKRISDLEVDSATKTEQISTLSRRVDNTEKILEAINTLKTNDELINRDLKEIKGDVSDVKQDVEKIKNLPAKNYNKLKMAIATGLISLIVGFFFGLLIMLI